MARPSGIRTFSRRVKRATDWQLGILAIGETSVPAAGKAVIASFSSATLAAIAPSTIIRTRGFFSIRSDQAAASELQIGAIGLGLVNEVARALGITALPGPLTDALWDGWFFHQFFSQSFIVADATGIADNAGAGSGYTIDSKAV